MLGSINSEIYLSHQNLSQIRKKICKLMQFSNNSHENSSIFDSIKLEIYLSHQNLSQIKRKICKLKKFSNNSRKNLQMLGSINLDIYLSLKFEPKATENQNIL